MTILHQKNLYSTLLPSVQHELYKISIKICPWRIQVQVINSNQGEKTIDYWFLKKVILNFLCSILY